MQPWERLLLILSACVVLILAFLMWRDYKWHNDQLPAWQTDVVTYYGQHLDALDGLCAWATASGATVQCPGSGTGRTPPPPPDYP